MNIARLSLPRTPLSGRCGHLGQSATRLTYSSLPAGPRHTTLGIETLPDRIIPRYVQTKSSTLLFLQWPGRPPRNVLVIPKLHAPNVMASVIAFAKHVRAQHPDLNLVFEARVGDSIQTALDFPIYTPSGSDLAVSQHLQGKIDLIATMGGDGTILRAASLFSSCVSVPPILAFSMGSLGFLGEWGFEEYKRAWREVYMSGYENWIHDLPRLSTLITADQKKGLERKVEPEVAQLHNGWDQVKGKSLGVARTSRILLRHRLKVGLYHTSGKNMSMMMEPTMTAANQSLGPAADLAEAAKASAALPEHSLSAPSFHAINELLIHRGPHPHLAVIDIYLNGNFLTEAVADGILVSTPTGSTAYSLSAGGSIVHPLVKSLLITPICPRSLSFRPLVLPIDTKVVLKLSDKNRGRGLELSIDGKRRATVMVGMQMQVEGEPVGGSEDGTWQGGVPCVIRAPLTGGAGAVEDDDDGWVGGLNGLLKFNYPFGVQS